MSLREKQQMILDTESATHSGMEGQSRSSHKYLLLQVWCGVLTVAMIVMATLLTSIKPKSTEGEVSTLKPDDVTPTVDNFVAPLKSKGCAISYIQLIKSPNNGSWQDSVRCDSCSLVLRDDSIYCTETGLYFIYAQVTFSQQPQKNPKSVILTRTTWGKSRKRLVEGTFPHTTQGSVWVGKIVRLTVEDSVSLDITGDILTDITFWGAYQLH